ncbi:hypothetical protein LSCM1_03207 [Leishmania martiniquensis]|uniref:Uncharacterized protein n=1 Tax=Leishmania martiniquensis TaxID=1580590 RepID=A0A836KKY5_9TRYP|nr:hypothetical protein LSCM1_03207 [Leishmania martiniquensis]
MQSVPAPPAAPTRALYTNAGEPDCAALRRLVASHHTFRANYKTLQKSDRVAVAFEGLCAEAVARSQLIERLALVLGSARPAAIPVRLLLTGSSDKVAAADPVVKAAVATEPLPAKALAVLEVPLSVVDWLREPIMVPELGEEALMESVHEVLSLLHADKNHASGFDAASGASPAPLYERTTCEAMKVWYDAWGRGQHSLDAATGPPESSHSLETRPLTASMTLWHRRQCALHSVLRSHFTEGGRPSVAGARRVRPAGCESGNTRDVLPIECGSTASMGTSRSLAEPNWHAALHPGRVVEETTRELLPYLVELLQTLSIFKAAREEATMQAEYYALLESATAAPSGSVADAATTAQGTYSNLSLVARRTRASPSVEPHPQPVHCDGSDQYFRDGCSADEELCTAAEGYLRSISKVDEVISHSDQSPSESEGATPLYSAAVLDMLMGVLLRCLLVCLPALSANDRGRVLKQLTAPWLTEAPVASARAACWSTLFGIADLLSKAHAPVRQGRIAAIPCAMVGPRGGGNANSALSLTADHSAALRINEVVRDLRSLCWPTVLDRQSSIVQHVLCLPPAIPAASPSISSSPASAPGQQQRRRPSTVALHGGTAHGVSASSAAAAHLSRSPRPRAPEWSDVVAVARGSERRQRLGYELLVLFFSALECGQALAATGPVTDTAAAAAAEERSLLSRRSAGRCPVSTACIYTLDVDRFMNERMRCFSPVGGLLPLLRTHSFSVTGRGAPPSGTRAALTQLLAEQAVHPYGLSRLVLALLGTFLLERWSTMRPQRARLLVEALQRAVAAPAALTLRSLLLGPHPGTRAGSLATPSSALQSAARCSEWRAVASVMSVFTTRATPSFWGTMWDCVSSELKSLPLQMREKRAAHASAGDVQGGDAAARGERGGTNGGQHAFCQQLEELASMCAWLVVMAPSAFDARVTGAGAATSASAKAPALGYRERVKLAFAHCVKSLLAVWTQTGASADAAERLLLLFPKHASTVMTPVEIASLQTDNVGAVAEVAQDANTLPPTQEESVKGEVVELLMEMLEAAQTHVWTRALRGAVEVWIAKTIYIQAHSKGVIQAVPLPTAAEASASALDEMPAAAAPSPAAGDDHLTGEATENGGTDALTLTASRDVDSVLLAWWRSIAEEDIGLPSTRIPLVQVYRVLLRIVATRGALAPSHPFQAKAHEEGAFASAQSSALAGTEMDASTGGSDGKPRMGLPDNTPAGAATSDALFSAAEVVVIVRVLSSIAARTFSTATLGSMMKRSCRWDAHGRASAAGSTESAVGGEATSRSGETIIDVLHRAAACATAVTAPNSAPSKDQSVSGGPIGSGEDGKDTPHTAGVEEEAVDQDRGGAAVLSAQKAVQRIEKALLISLKAHSGALPAATVMEATWLGLLPLSALQRLLGQQEWSTTIADQPDATPRGHSPSASVGVRPAKPTDLRAGTAALPPSHLPGTAAASPDPALHLDGSLRESPSLWLRQLHDAVVASSHTREVGICLVSSMYSFLAAPQKGGCIDPPLCGVTPRVRVRTAGNGDSASCDDTSVAVPSCASSSANGADALSRLRGFLTRLRTSCAEAVVLLHQASRQGSDFTALPAKGGAIADGGANAKDTGASRAGVVASASAAAAEADRDDGDDVDVGVSRSATLHDGHGRRFCHVLVVTSELHERLLPYTEASTFAAAGLHLTEQGAAEHTLPNMRIGKDERVRRQLWLLYRSLLDAVAYFVPYGEHGNAVEVMQMLAVITRRMPWQQCAPERLVHALPIDKDGHLRDNSSGWAGVEAAPPTKHGQGILAAAPSAPLSTLGDGSDEGAMSGPLLHCFREQVARLMPYVDAEVLRCTKMRSPVLLRLALIGAAKSSVEYVLRSTPLASRRSTLRCEEASAVTAGGTRSGVAFEPSSARTTAKMSAVEAASPSTTKEAASDPLERSTRPLWSQVPLASLMHRLAMDRLMMSRHALHLCTLVTNAPEFSLLLLPLSHWLRDAQARISWDMLEVVFKAMAVAAANLQRHNQAEMLLRDAYLPPPSPSASPRSDQAPSGAASSADRASLAASADRSRRSLGDGDAPRRGELVLPRPLSGGSSLRVGEVRYPLGGNGAAPAPFFRSAGGLTTMWNAPSQLRHTWGDLARRLLREEDDVALRDSSLWVSALYCGAMVNCAGTQVFAQLLACLVFGATTPEASTPAATTRIATLDVVGWSLVLESCGTALDQRYRQSYQALLRDEFAAFLKRAAASAQGGEGVALAPSTSSSSPSTVPSVSTAELWRGVLDDELPLAGAWRCGLLEAIPQLFVEDAKFWGLVKCCVESWCALIELEPVERAGEMPSAQRKSTSAARRSWVTQLHQSFNWAAQCAGQPSLVFTDTWTTMTADAGTHAATEWMKMQLESLGTSAASETQSTEVPASAFPPSGE